MIGQILDGRYEIQRELGSGGLATVYLGQTGRAAARSP